MKENNQVLYLNMSKKLAPSISTRVAIHILMNELASQNKTDIILDFSNISSISRSAAHEMILMRSDLVNKFRKQVEFRNMNQVIQDIIRAVTDNAINTKPKERLISTHQVSFEKLCDMVL